MSITALPALAALLASASPAFASTAAPVAASTENAAAASEQEPIIVTGQRAVYGVAATSSATRTNTLVRDIPQALSVISEQQVEDQQLRSVADLLYFVPGATPGTGEGNRDQFTLRGTNSTADFFVDGIRDDVQYSRDLYNSERIEVLRGANAMIFGRGGGGGVINRVTKRSTLARHGDFALSLDGHGGVRLTGDLDQRVAPGAGLRVNAMAEDAGSFRRHVELERWAVNPTLGIIAGPRTRIDVGVERLHDRRTTDRGVPAEFDRPLKGYDRTFFGDPELSFARADATLGTLAVQHELADGLTLRHRTLWADYDKYYQNIYPTDLDEAAAKVSLGAYNSRNDRRNLIGQTDLIWDTRLGGIDHVLLAGVELGRQRSRNQRLSGTFAPGTSKVPLADPTVDASVSFAPSASDANNRTRATIAAIYLQDQIRLSPALELVAGLRLDRFELKVDDYRAAGGEFARTDTLVSPRLGLVARPLANLSLYASYSRSYLPQSGEQFAGLDLTSAALKPERFDNYEAGAKWEPLPGLLATAAIYQLDRSNTRAPSPAAGGLPVLTGEQRSRGIELGLERSISDRWLVSAGYTLQKSHVRERTAACDPAAAKCEVPLVPRHALSLWNRVDVSKTLGLGLGVIARSKSFASISNAVTLPAFARVDAAAYYKLGRGIEAQVNVENLLGANYFPTAHNDNNIAPGAPRTVKGTIRFGF